MRSVSMSFSPAEIKAKSTRTLSSWVAVKQKISNDVHYFSRLTLKCIIQAKINIFLRRGKHKFLLNVRKAGEIRGSNLGDRLWQQRVVCSDSSSVSVSNSTATNHRMPQLTFDSRT